MQRLTRRAQQPEGILVQLPAPPMHMHPGLPFVTHKGVWPSALILEGNATLFVSEHAYS
jgi:hypothetical protein